MTIYETVTESGGIVTTTDTGRAQQWTENGHRVTAVTQ